MENNNNDGITILSLFDGISCGRIALDRAGIKVNQYFASEIDKHAIKVAQHNWPETIQLGSVVDVKAENLPKIDLLIGGSPCFVKDTQVLTNKGYKNIQDIKIGDSVLSHTGNWRKVLNIGGRENAQTRIVKGFGNLGTETTNEHPFFTRQMFREYIPNLKTTVRKFTDPTWEKAENLNKNSYYSNVKIRNSKKSSNCIFWYMIGRYTGDGWYRKTKRKYRENSYIYQFIICCGKSEFKELQNKFEEFGLKYNFSEERTGYKFRICSQKLVEFVEKIGKGASNKVVHPDLFTASKNDMIAYLEGLFDSDGCYLKKRNSYKLTSTSKILIMGVQQIILNAYNSPSSIEFIKTSPTCIIEGRTCNQKDYYNLIFKKDVRKQDKAFFENDFSWMPIKFNEPTGKANTVYNLEVEIDNSYTANNMVVHNCQGFSFMGNQLNFNDIRSKLFFEFVRLLKECKPRYFLLENVKMKKEFEDVISKELGVQPVKINSSLLTAHLRSRYYWTNIPNVTIPEDKGITLNSVLEFGHSEREKSVTLLASYGDKTASDSGVRHYKTRRVGQLIPDDNSPTGYRKLTVVEASRLQTAPDNYLVDVKDVSDKEKYRQLGNGWTVAVIEHLFKGLKTI